VSTTCASPQARSLAGKSLRDDPDPQLPRRLKHIVADHGPLVDSQLEEAFAASAF